MDIETSEDMAPKKGDKPKKPVAKKPKKTIVKKVKAKAVVMKKICPDCFERFLALEKKSQKKQSFPKKG